MEAPLRIDIRQSSFYPFSVVVGRPLVSDIRHVPIVLTTNFHDKSDFRYLTAEGQQLARALLIDQMIHIGTVRICEQHFSPQYSNDAFKHSGAYQVEKLLSLLREVFKQRLEVVVFISRLSAEVIKAFESKEVLALPGVTLAFERKV